MQLPKTEDSGSANPSQKYEPEIPKARRHKHRQICQDRYCRPGYYLAFSGKVSINTLLFSKLLLTYQKGEDERFEA